MTSTSHSLRADASRIAVPVLALQGLSDLTTDGDVLAHWLAVDLEGLLAARRVEAIRVEVQPRFDEGWISVFRAEGEAVAAFVAQLAEHEVLLSALDLGEQASGIRIRLTVSR